jgi:hypothetical protein
MAYLGNAPARSFISFERQVFTIVNSQTAYTLDHSVNNENDIRLVINNIVQEPGSGKAYTASGTTLTLSAALTNGTDEMYCVFLGRAVATNAPGAGSVGASQLASDAVTSAKLNDDIISGQTELAAEPADTDEFLVSDAGTLKRIDYSLIKSSAGAYESQLLHVRQEVNAGTDSQTLSNSGANTRVLDTVKTNEITGASLSSNEITLPAGTYFCLASAPAYLTSNHQCRLYNTTDSADVLEGTTEHAWNNGYTTTHSFLRGRFTISGTKGFTLRHYVGQTRNDSGGGTSFSGGGSKNIYAEVMIWKVA